VNLDAATTFELMLVSFETMIGTFTDPLSLGNPVEVAITVFVKVVL
jgi:hypothetical protein